MNFFPIYWAVIWFSSFKFTYLVSYFDFPMLKHPCISRIRSTSLYLFPVASVTDSQIHSSLKYHTFNILQFLRSEIQSGSCGLNQGVGRAIVLLEVLGENMFPCLFQFLRASCIPWLVVPSSIFKARGSNLHFHVHIFSPTLTLLLPSYEDSCDYNGLTG